MGTLSVDKLLKTSTGAAEFTLPATDGTAGQAMITDGSGQLNQSYSMLSVHIKICNSVERTSP